MTMSLAQTVTVTGNIPYATDLKKGDGSLEVWTMSKIREDKHNTVNPIEGSVMIKDNNSRGDKLGDTSETPNETKNYGGTLDLTNTVLPATIAILVDDIATLTITEIPNGNEPVGHAPFADTYKVEGTALWNPKSYKEFSTPLPPGRKYQLDLVYKNTANLTANYTDGKVDVDGVSVYVCLLQVEVNWRAIDGFDNVDDHVDPWNNPIYGKRIFPEFKNPDDTEIRHKLEVVVKTSPALFGKTVYVKSFDVDDSTSEVFDLDESGTTTVIDTNGKAGKDNLTDYLNTPQNGQFWTGSNWGGQTAQGTVDANGETKFIFRVGMQPGSNYRVVASVIDETMYAGVQTSDPAKPKYLGPETSQNVGAAASPLLTVWRRLWVENDSMEAIPVDALGYSRNDLSSELYPPVIRNVNYSATNRRTSFGIDMIRDQSSFLNLENGWIIFQSLLHPVIDTHSYSVTVAGNHGSVPINSEYRLYDDDDFGLNRAPLPRNDLIDDTFKNVFKPAFIDAVDAANFNGQDYNPNKTVPFHRTYPVEVGPWFPINLQGPGIWDDVLNLTDSKPLWVGNIIAGYQGEVGDDGDPRSESIMEGGTPGSRRYSIVYVENIRDTLDPVIRNPLSDNTVVNSEIERNIKLTAAHEIGHMPGNGDEKSHHAEGLLMGSGGNENGLEFSAHSILRFRKTNQWQQP